LGWQPKQLQHLEEPFYQIELKQVIHEARTDGFIGLFFSSCWDTIKEDLIQATEHFFSFNQQGLQFLNQAYIVLVPKIDCPQRITEYRPISLIHIFTKIISKLLANRLSPELQHLIANNQSTFIKKRCIHNCFMFVQHVVRMLHKNKTPTLFVKLDIYKVFDTVNWPYLLGIMTHRGFELKWIN
jgi:hypothetical protein